MAVRARLGAPQRAQESWPWHEPQFASLPASLLFGGDRRMEAESYLTSGFGIRLAIESKATGWSPLSSLARTWQPSRLKGIQVSRNYGTPFLGATQVFDLRPVARKWLSLGRTEDAAGRFVDHGTILLTCSGNVGRATLAHAPHEGLLISHDLLRVSPNEDDWWGWIYAYLRAPTVREMMKGAHYGHIIKHLETSHLDALPVITLSSGARTIFNEKAREVLRLRNRAYRLSTEAERQFETAVGVVPLEDTSETGFSVAASTLARSRRRFDAWPNNPRVTAIYSKLAKTGRGLISLRDLGLDIWMPNRFRRIEATTGVQLVGSAELFEINPDTRKTIADIDFGDRLNGRVQAGWVLLARSGQIYGINGSLALATPAHEGKVVSDDVIRIAHGKKPSDVRLGYLFVALSHPTLGSPLVKALAYGSSIPHIDVADMQDLRLVRLSKNVEVEIADKAEEASRLQSAADILETALADDADEVVRKFLADAAPAR